MPVFISYSHSDELIVNKLTAHLIKHNANVWIDTWEINVGESILNKVQDAIQESSVLLVILSKASIQSEWCKKELSAGLMRELGEKRVIVLPVLVEDCEIPIFLKEKMFADLRTDFEKGLTSILNAIASVTNVYQSRFEEDERNIDWAEDWGFKDDLFHLRYTIVDSPKSLPMTFITQVFVYCTELTTKRYLQYESAGFDWIGKLMIAEALFDLGEKKDYRVVLTNQFPKEINSSILDPKIGIMYEVYCECRKLGLDNGKDQLINISEYLRSIREYVRNVSRKPTREELMKIAKIVKSDIE